MGLLKKIDSNVTGLAYAEEDSLAVLPGSPVWRPLEPNSYSEFGGQITTVARAPINPSRQRKKGVTTDLAASAGFSTDLTQTNLQDLFQGFFFADLRRKAEINTTGSPVTLAVLASDDSFNAASGLDVFRAGDLIQSAGFPLAANNNAVLRVLTAISTKITTSGVLADDTSSTATLVAVGFQFGSGEVDIDITGTYPKLTRASGSKDMTQFGLVPGEFIFVGGDDTAEKFTNAANNGFCRVRSVATTYIEFDKTDQTMVNETGTAKTIRLFFGRVLKNETGDDIVRRSYNLERQLGAPDDSSPTDFQAEYVVGAVGNKAKFNSPNASKFTVDLDFVGTDSETQDADTGPKSGTRVDLVESNAFNTSSDVTKFKIAEVVPGEANPDSLFSFIEQVDWTIDNGITPDKAVAILGAFEVSTGDFKVDLSMQAYFATVDAIQAVRDNADVTFEYHLVRANSGISIDMPLIALADSRPNVEKDVAVKVPLTASAATGALVDPNKDHTLLMVFFDYLPNLAD